MNIKQHLKPYILNNSLECTLSEFFKEYETEFNNTYNKKFYPNQIQRLGSYLSGLPNGIDIPFSYYDIRQLVLSFNPTATEKTLKRYENNFFLIVADILLTEYNKQKTTI